MESSKLPGKFPGGATKSHSAMTTAKKTPSNKHKVMRAGFFTYPWDLQDEGVESTIEAMALQYGCNAIALNCSYHHARLFRPRARGSKTLQLPDAVAAFEPQKKWYARGALMPKHDQRLVKSRVLEKAREACTRQKMDFGLWVVGLHNSTLGEQHPECCVQNCFGDTYSYQLCPSNSAVQDYLRGLISDVCSQFHPDRIILEAVGHLGWRHGTHHEISQIVWSDALDFLLSLCFCPSCVRQAKRKKVDAESLRRRVVEWVECTINEERSSDFTQKELSSLLVEIPELDAYLRISADTVENLVSLVRSVTQSFKVALEVIPASFHFPSSQAWVEHVRIEDLGKASDGLVILAYHNNVPGISNDLGWASSRVPRCSIIAGLSAGPRLTRDESALVAAARATKAAGCAAVYYYNYGLLTSQRLSWVGRANAALQI
jgi:hypothetical protein